MKSAYKTKAELLDQLRALAKNAGLDSQWVEQWKDVPKARLMREITPLLPILERIITLTQQQVLLLRRIDDQRAELATETTSRVAAQNGLTPYVYALQAFNQWVGDNPELSKSLKPVMAKLGIWGVKVGYDPQKDLALSIISPSRHRT